MNATDTTAPTAAEMDLMIKAVTSREKHLIGPPELRDSIEAKGYAYRLQGKHVEGVMVLTQKGSDLAYETHMAREGVTIEPPFTDADALEDSALLKALEVKSGNVHAPDGARLVAQGLAWVDEERGHYFLTDDGRAAAEALRDIERDLITDEMLEVINQCGGGRAQAKATGWIAGVTQFEQRVYIERVRLPHTSPYTFSTFDGWTNLRFQLFSKLGIHAEIEGNRLYFGALRPSRRGNTPQLGEPDEERSERIHAGQHADAVWSDLCNQEAGAPFRLAVIDADGPRDVYMPPAAWIFHHFSRDVRLDLDEHGRYRVTVTAAPDAGWDTPPAAAVWTGHRADVAVKAMARALYSTKCAHGYGTGRDSCPGCDYTAELFEERYPLRGYGMRSLVLH
ncbi:hypothetical protein FNV58_01015 (plasmid) [Streptomyces sp. RLB1-9]|uniref:hypothetical protein n=1 Tax=Streptomyces sp. RLB1-9 TaxID=2594454 RepID=UPI001164114A|nr:hypothetical protein [Streptomyces sp. RLB1-9]QDN94941.1 hypothetical protein FNV58_01015 [Streptomyces sp. RLB1-9]